MATLPPALRRKLENAVQEARDVAEAGARAALRALAVDGAEPFGHLSADQRALRNRLRARARQLGDRRDPTKGTHGIEHLVVECGYEHWHRMLFARFLAENGLLMHPDHGVAVTLEECEELAPDEGAETAWELAGRFASRMLPQIFRPDAPVLEVRLPPEHERKLEQLLSGLDPATFKASDALGWVYQFWQAKKKDEVNSSGVKIGADELPAVTQLFTEPYMVQFLLHNTLGAWWVGRHGRDSLPIEMPYLRFLDDGTPAAGTFDDWPETAAEIKVLDPCCGSGHFLVAAFEILVRFRMVEEGLSAADACDAVLRDNLHGLELDERCTQIAAFALAFSAWMLPQSGGYRRLPPMRIACSGLAPRAKRDEWLRLAAGDPELATSMGRLYDLFVEAPLLGSLVDPAGIGWDGAQRELGTGLFDDLATLMDRALGGNASEREMAVTARGLAEAGELLAGQYTVILTNVPYLVRAKQSSRLKTFCERYYPLAKRDLATVFFQRLLKLVAPEGVLAVTISQFDRGSLLSSVVTSYHGISTTDYARFGRLFWELPRLSSDWLPQQSTVRQTCDFGGREHVLRWAEDGKELREFAKSGAAVVITGLDAWSRKGVAVSQMGDLPVTLYTGGPFDDNTAVLIPKREEDLPAVWEFCRSSEYAATVRQIDHSFKVTYPTLAKVPWDASRWREAAPNDLPAPCSTSPDQSIFHGHPADSSHALQVAICRLLGYQWPTESTDGDGLSAHARSWLNRAKDLDAVADDDGIVCIPAVRGEHAAHVRLEQILATAFADAWSSTTLATLLKAASSKGWTLDRWLRDKFFQQHCDLFQQRPFIWHIWDGLPKGGFGALVNYHKLDRKLLETLTYTYLGDWIRRQQDGVSRGEDGADERLTAAQGLQEKLKAILKGEPPCDIFVRWKPIEEQPMGWDPDLDDGVRVNIRPFMLVGDVKYKGAGVLRRKPRIHWKKDRGTDPPDAPWYDLGPKYGEKNGARINDHHLTLDEKRKARAEKEGK